MAGDKDDEDGGIYIQDSESLNTEITNATLTITIYESSNKLNFNGLGINEIIDLSVTNIEDVMIYSPMPF